MNQNQNIEVPALTQSKYINDVVLCFCFSGHAHLTDFNIATIIKDGERATALAGTKPYMGNIDPPLCPLNSCSFSANTAVL